MFITACAGYWTLRPASGHIHCHMNSTGNCEDIKPQSTMFRVVSPLPIYIYKHLSVTNIWNVLGTVRLCWPPLPTESK